MKHVPATIRGGSEQSMRNLAGLILEESAEEVGVGPTCPPPTSSRLSRLYGNDPHRAEQARGKQRRIRLVRLHVRHSVLGRSRLLIANQAIDPGILHLDLYLVSPRL